MRTTLDLDDALMEALSAAFRGASKTEAIEAARHRGCRDTRRRRIVERRRRL